MAFIPVLIAALFLAITPGAGTAYRVPRTVAGGRKEGLASCLGTSLGSLLHVLAAALGLYLLLVESAMAFDLVKYVGAAYLVYLGVQMLMQKATFSPVVPVSARCSRRAFLEYILVEAFNVKTALFVLAFLPQFTSAGQPLAAQLVMLADVVAVMAAHRLLKPPAGPVTRAHLLTRAPGVTMLGLGAWLALTQR